MVDMQRAIQFVKLVRKVLKKLPKDARTLTGTDELLIEAESFLIDAGINPKEEKK